MSRYDVYPSAPRTVSVTGVKKDAAHDPQRAGTDAAFDSGEIEAAMLKLQGLSHVTWNSIRSQLYDAYIEDYKYTGTFKEIYETRMRELEAKR